MFSPNQISHLGAVKEHFDVAGGGLGDGGGELVPLVLTPKSENLGHLRAHEPRVTGMR